MVGRVSARLRIPAKVLYAADSVIDLARGQKPDFASSDITPFNANGIIVDVTLDTCNRSRTLAEMS